MHLRFHETFKSLLMVIGMLPGKYLVKKHWQRNKPNKDFQVLLKMKIIILIPASLNPTPSRILLMLNGVSLL